MFTFEGVGVGAVDFGTFFLEPAGLVLIEAGFSIPAIGEIGALNNTKRNKNTFNK